MKGERIAKEESLGKGSKMVANRPCSTTGQLLGKKLVSSRVFVFDQRFSVQKPKELFSPHFVHATFLLVNFHIQINFSANISIIQRAKKTEVQSNSCDNLSLPRSGRMGKDEE